MKKNPITSRFAWNYMAILLAMIFTSTNSMAQRPGTSDEKNFQIMIKQSEQGIILRSIQGSAWKLLSLTMEEGEPQAIDEYGMANLHDVSAEKNAELADYLFTITKTGQDFQLKGMEGTTWSELNFTLEENGRQLIDQQGLKTLMRREGNPARQGKARKGKRRG